MWLLILVLAGAFINSGNVVIIKFKTQQQCEIVLAKFSVGTVRDAILAKACVQDPEPQPDGVGK